MPGRLALDHRQNLQRLRSLGVVFVGSSEQDTAIAIKNKRRRNRQLPTRVAVHEGQIDEGASVKPLLFVGDAIHQSELACQLVARIDQQRKGKLVLVTHEEGLLLRLRRDGNQRSSRALNLGGNVIHGFHLPHAEWTPAPADEYENQPSFAQKISGRNGYAD